ncbi:hydroxyisourate hydrolase [Acinetobacter sp. ANC 4945]|uniref:5-hydroxyisourate hydrolase n=1 Tax=Acinetobacter amyesii TaxID=2942470 RepID=A0A1T1GUP6_9GAMM|nr:hydroxyisourate hydrolase [Acinetobacter amyesii]MCL6247978.1 hydroxyisourate hydrolase [Acinetobacter amyesii]OOV81190.1 hydroxyisourate hydrolase [Acinetobacter amyesii]
MISSHILDTNLGKPAANVRIQLFNADGELLGSAQTNADGRVNDFALKDFTAGAYSLEFATAEYFQTLNTETFFPKAVIHFYVKDASQHFHIPLLISPFAYSTYRGS